MFNLFKLFYKSFDKAYSLDKKRSDNFDTSGNDSITAKQRKDKDDILYENDHIFQNLFEHSPIGNSMTGVDGSIHVNKSFCKIVGYSEKELKTKKWQDITHPDDIKLTSDLMQSLLKGEISQSRFEKRFIHKNGSIIWTDILSYLERDKNGKPQFFVTTITDINERKKAEERLQIL
jgi:PAS domain S-box-containing protein